MKQRRRIDIVLDPEFVAGLEALDLNELRERKRMADEVETELSYYRRLLHGRLDLLSFEERRRRGEESRSLIEALPEVLGAGEAAGGGRSRFPTVFAPEFPDDRRREIDHILEDDFLARLPDLTDEEMAQIRATLGEAEQEISAKRKQVQAVVDALHAELLRRYKQGTADLTIL
jgi:hypothetical protein